MTTGVNYDIMTLIENEYFKIKLIQYKNIHKIKYNNIIADINKINEYKKEIHHCKFGKILYNDDEIIEVFNNDDDEYDINNLYINYGGNMIEAMYCGNFNK